MLCVRKLTNIFRNMDQCVLGIAKCVQDLILGSALCRLYQIEPKAIYVTWDTSACAYEMRVILYHTPCFTIACSTSWDNYFSICGIYRESPRFKGNYSSFRLSASLLTLFYLWFVVFAVFYFYVSFEQQRGVECSVLLHFSNSQHTLRLTTS